MGGEAPRIYDRPVPGYPADKWRSTYRAHTQRNPPSREPGVDYYCPLGTVLVALGDGYVSEIGGSVHPATGRYVRVNMDNGQGFRLLHLGPGHSLVPLRGRVKQGQPLAISGASGYGSEYFGASNPYDAQMIWNTGGPHTHLSLFPRWGAAYAETIDPEPWMKEDEMNAEQEAKLNLLIDMIGGAGGVRNALNDPNLGLAALHGKVDIVRADAGNAANIASSVRNLITDPERGVLVAISRVVAGDGDLDEAALASILEAIHALPDETIAALKAAL